MSVDATGEGPQTISVWLEEYINTTDVLQQSQVPTRAAGTTEESANTYRANNVTSLCSVLCCTVALLRLLCLVIAVLPRRTEAIPCAAMTMFYAVTYCAFAAPLLFG